jgi:hypothetical protein
MAITIPDQDDLQSALMLVNFLQNAPQVKFTFSPRAFEARGICEVEFVNFPSSQDQPFLKTMIEAIVGLNTQFGFSQIIPFDRYNIAFTASPVNHKDIGIFYSNLFKQFQAAGWNVLKIENVTNMTVTFAKFDAVMDVNVQALNGFLALKQG